MPFLAIAAGYAVIGLFARSKYYPREPVYMAGAWPIIFFMGGR